MPAAPRRRRSPATLTALAGAVTSLTLLAACSSDPPATPAAVAVTTPTPTPTPSEPTPTPTPEPTTSPLSGRKGGIGTPVVVVKLDNTPSAQPHRGLTSADIVYVEPVEWGLNRLAAVFSTTLPDTVGPVRSARISDIEMFAQFGDVAFVYSGAQTRLLDDLAAAGFTTVSEDAGDAGFYRDAGRVMPYNLMAQPREIVTTSGATAVATDMGWVFSRKRPSGGKSAEQVTVRWPQTSMQFRWDGDADAYDVWSSGRASRAAEEPGVQRASTVIVQYVEEVDSGFGDKFGGRTPESITVGSGKALLLRNGRAYKITWERPTAEQPTAYLGADGEPIAFDPGQIWIILHDQNRPAQVE